MTILSFLFLVRNTRESQVKYFKYKTKAYLQKAVEYEYKLDKALKEFEAQHTPEELDTQLSLFK